MKGYVFPLTESELIEVSRYEEKGPDRSRTYIWAIIVTGKQHIQIGRAHV